MSGWPANQGDSNQNQQYYYDDGKTRVSYSSSSWTTVQPGTPIQTSVPLVPQPQMIPGPDFGQIHQMHMNMHQATIQNHFNIMQANFNNMAPMFQPQQPVLMPASPSPEGRIEYFEEDSQSPPIEQFQANSPQLQIEYNQTPTNQIQDRELAIPQVNSDAHDGERRKELIRETSKLEKRLQRMEQSQSQSREQQEAKEREIAAGRAREEQLQQQMLELEQCHSQQMADMAKSRAAAPQPSPAFDMDVLQNMISQAQGDRISKEDIKTLIKNSVNQQLSGIAKASDIEPAASRMERGLKRAPKGASADEIQKTIQKELANAVNQVVRFASKSQKTIQQPAMQSQVFEDQSASPIRHDSFFQTLPQQQPMLDFSQTVVKQPKQLDQNPAAAFNNRMPSIGRDASPQQNVQSGVSARSFKRLTAPSSEQQPSQPIMVVGNAPANEQPTRKPKQLIPPSTSLNTQPALELTEGALAKLTRDNGGEPDSSKSRHSKTRASVKPTSENALVRTKHRERDSGSIPKMSAASVQPSASNTVAKVSTSESAGNRESSHREQKAYTSSKKSTVSVQASPGNTPVQPSHETLHREHREHQSSKKSTASVLASNDNTLVRAGQSSSRAPVIPAETNIPEKSRSGQTNVQSSADPGTVAKVRPRNDRREETSARILPQRMQSVPEEAEGSSGALLKHRRDKSKKPDA